MGERHRIDELVFDTRLEGVDHRRAPWPEWPAICRDRLLAVIDRVFDEFSPDAATLHRLEHLEVDLGAFSGEVRVEQVAARLESALRQALHDRFRGLGEQSGPQVVSREVADLQGSGRMGAFIRLHQTDR